MEWAVGGGRAMGCARWAISFARLSMIRYMGENSLRAGDMREILSGRRPSELRS